MVQKTEQHFTVISLPQTGAGCDGGESSTVYSQAWLVGHLATWSRQCSLRVRGEKWKEPSTVLRSQRGN